MFTLPYLSLWLVLTLTEAFVVYFSVVRGVFLRFLCFNTYFVLCVTTSIARYAILYQFGFISSEYAYFYYYTDALLVVSLFLAVCELSVRLVGTKTPGRRAILCLAGVFLLATVFFSLAIVSASSSRPATRFVVELSRNLDAVCCLALVLLWAWRLRNEPEDWMAARLVTVLGVYFALFFVIFGARQLYLSVRICTEDPSSMMAAWLPLGYGFAIVRDD